MTEGDLNALAAELSSAGEPTFGSRPIAGGSASGGRPRAGGPASGGRPRAGEPASGGRPATEIGRQPGSAGGSQL